MTTVKKKTLNSSVALLNTFILECHEKTILLIQVTQEECERVTGLCRGKMTKR